MKFKAGQLINTFYAVKLNKLYCAEDDAYLFHEYARDIIGMVIGEFVLDEINANKSGWMFGTWCVILTQHGVGCVHENMVIRGTIK